MKTNTCYFVIPCWLSIFGMISCFDNQKSFRVARIMTPDVWIKTPFYLFHCDLIVCPLPPLEEKKVSIVFQSYDIPHWFYFREEVIYLFLLMNPLLANLLIRYELFHFGLTLCTVFCLHLMLIMGELSCIIMYLSS